MKIYIANYTLLPCPFCGENPIKFRLESGTWIIECRGGKCTFKPSSLYSYEIEERAIEAWNKRDKFSPDWDNYQQGRKDALQEAHKPHRELDTPIEGIKNENKRTD